MKVVVPRNPKIEAMGMGRFFYIIFSIMPFILFLSNDCSPSSSMGGELGFLRVEISTAFTGVVACNVLETVERKTKQRQRCL